MGRVKYHEHPGQSGRCLPGAFDAYVQRIPVEQYGSLDAVWRAIQERRFEADDGNDSPGGRKDARCSPVQRSRIWPATMNCWEETAHWTAGAKRFLSDAYLINVWDGDLRSGARHVWPSLVLPNGRHLIIFLQSARPKDVPTHGYHGALLPANADTQQYVDTGLNLVGGVGGAVVGAFAGQEAGNLLAKGIGGIEGIVDSQAFGAPSGAPARIPSPQELEGRLVQADGNPRVYRIEDGKKRWVPSEDVMRKRFASELVNGRWTGVVYVPPQALSAIPDGPQLDDMDSAPAGKSKGKTKPARKVRIRTRSSGD